MTKPPNAASRIILCVFLAGFWSIALWGCAPEESIPLDVPEGWQNDGAYWWKTDLDTLGTFPDLESLASMGIETTGLSEPLGMNPGESNRAARRRLVTHVKDSLIPLFRNQPDVVDSLFERFVVPKMADARIEGDVNPVIKTFKLEGYRTIARFFREPYSMTKMGIDIPVPIPDSLRDNNIVGRVFMQVYISDEGDPLTIKKLSGVHPVLDRIAVRAMTKMKWQPAYLLKGGKARPIESWARFNVDFANVQ